jgi:hypothetical protein
MPAAIKRDDYDDEVYLAVRRDLPMIQSDISEIKGSIKELTQKSAADDVRATKQESKMDAIGQNVTDLKEEVQKLADKPAPSIPIVEPIPWYKDFRNILIIVGLVSFLIQSLATSNPQVATALIDGIAGVFGSEITHQQEKTTTTTESTQSSQEEVP